MRPRRWLSLLPLVACLGCADKDAPTSDEDDADGDGYATPYDCDDHDPDVHPEAPERCNWLDDDCDFEVDEDPVDGFLWYRDQDGDGYGLSALPRAACYPDEDEIGTPGDCDDLDPDVSPAAEELCDGQDDDCDGVVDEDSARGASVWYLDGDGDGYGDSDRTWVSCEAPPGYVNSRKDCDDTDASVAPGEPEYCDGQDDDCDGDVDESALDMVTSYRDDDRDGFGQSRATRIACEVPEGYALIDGDCDDAEAYRYPGAEEVCDHIDENCDGIIDNDAVDETTWHRDLDGDGQGEATGTYDRVACEAPDAYVAESGDCDDDDDAIYLGAMERCGSGVDGDCDGALSPCDFEVLERGDGEIQQLGAALSGAGDLDGDGLVDVVLGAPVDPAGAGQAILRQSAGGGVTWSGAAGDGAGRALAGGADLDGDGVADLLVGAPDASTGVGGAGAVYGLLEPAAGGALAGADLLLQGDAAEQHLGRSLALIADLDGSGQAGALVGAPGAEEGVEVPGAAYLYAGWLGGAASTSDARAVLLGETAGDQAGGAVASGDLNGDGIADLLVGAPTAASGAGRVYGVLGPVSGSLSLSDADLVLEGSASAGRAGSALLAPGDLDGDGALDLVVAAPRATTGGAEEGVVYAVCGPGDPGALADLACATFSGEDAAGRAGGALAAADLDGDGVLDLAVGAPLDGADGDHAGTVWLVHGPLAGALTTAEADARLPADRAASETGGALTAPGDLDGDGRADLLVGAPHDSAGGSDAGAVILLTWPG